MNESTRFEFRSSKFPPYPGEEEQINPGLWGRRLAEYLKERLARRGIESGDIVLEDWGCLRPVKNEAFALALACGHQSGEDDEFLCFIEPSAPCVRKLFRKIDTTREVERLSRAVQQVLSSDPDIRELRCERAQEP